MAKIFSKILLIILFLLVSFIGFFSLVGFETKSFNKQIKENLKKVDKNLDVRLNDVKIILDLFSLNINAKTLGPTISYNKKSIDIELIKSDISLFNLINKEFSLSNLFISTKSIKLKDVVAFVRAVNTNNKAELFILESFIDKGYLIANMDLNFDDQGKIKDNFKFKGYVKDGSINLLNKKKIEDVNFIFETQNKDLEIKDLNLSYEKINFQSEKIEANNKGKFTNIEGELDSTEGSLSEDLLEDITNSFLKMNLKNLKFSSKNKFSLKVDNKFKISDYEIKSLLNINELLVENNINLKKIFPNSQPKIILKNHQIETNYKKNSFLINGNGDFLIQKNFDKATYRIEHIGNKSFFDIKLDFVENHINFDFLNYSTDKKSKAYLELEGKLIKNKTLEFKKIKFGNSSDLININSLILNNDFKITSMESATFNFTDKQNKRNIFQIKGNNGNYKISGKVFNASKLIENLIFKDTDNNNIFAKDYALLIEMNEVYLHKDHIVYDLKGNLKYVDNNLIKANINSRFNENEKVNFTVISNGDQKVTTLFSDQAKPFVEKFNFINGFDNGSLDFYSVKSKDISNSKLKIYEFKLKEVPALTKILTLASLQGIADLLSGEGIRFSEFEMNFQNKNRLMTIDEIYAIGPAISILMEGYIEKSKLISLRGTLVPATTINKVIGSIPLIGDILVGKKTGEGVFGVSFKIKGPPKKLETSVNPIKTLTPRFITRTLEKIKKN
tara:strand:- start:1373 stop:3565 length:2193 start_codon:yes stop_codon:yes gene_type:complete